MFLRAGLNQCQLDISRLVKHIQVHPRNFWNRKVNARVGSTQARRPQTIAIMRMRWIDVYPLLMEEDLLTIGYPT
jgi:hypothetical protein